MAGIHQGILQHRPKRSYKFHKTCPRHRTVMHHGRVCLQCQAEQRLFEREVERLRRRDERGI
jgi:hypothetical protein